MGVIHQKTEPAVIPATPPARAPRREATAITSAEPKTREKPGNRSSGSRFTSEPARPTIRPERISLVMVLLDKDTYRRTKPVQMLNLAGFTSRRGTRKTTRQQLLIGT